MATPKFKFDDTLTVGLSNYFKKIGMATNTGVDFIARKECAIQFLSNTINGSSKSQAVPPIKDGILRASGSIFVNNDFIADTTEYGSSGTPAKSVSGNEGRILVVYNTAYAAIQHEKLTPAGPFKLGPVSAGAPGEPQGKWIEAHLNADGQDLMKQYALVLKRETGG